MKRAGQASKAGTKVSRIIRIVRLVRLIRIVKLYKHAQQVIFSAESLAIEGMEESKDDEIQPDVKPLSDSKMGDTQNKEIQKDTNSLNQSDINSLKNERKKAANTIENEDNNNLPPIPISEENNVKESININPSEDNNKSQETNLAITQNPNNGKNETDSNENQSVKKYESELASKKKQLAEPEEIQEEVSLLLTLHLLLFSCIDHSRNKCWQKTIRSYNEKSYNFSFECDDQHTFVYC